MRLADAQYQEDVEEALAADDPEMKADIANLIHSHVEAALHWALHPGTTSRPYEISSDGPQKLNEDLDRSGLEEHLLDAMEKAHPDLFGDVPEGLVSLFLHNDLRYATKAWAKDGEPDRSELIEFRMSLRPRSPVAGASGSIHIAPIPFEISIPQQEGLELVPAHHMIDELSAAGPDDANWQATGHGWWYSGIVDHPNLDLVARPKPEGFREWLVDLRTRYYSNLVNEDPEKAVAAFMRILETEHPKVHAKLKKAKLPADVLADYAVAYFEDPEEGLAVIQEAMGLWGYEGTKAETRLTIDRDVLRELGITSGRFWDGAPWSLLNLPPAELAYEGTSQRHCVGRHDMGYREGVEGGEIEIWSLRSKHNKPLLTFEVDMELWEPEYDPMPEDARAVYRGRALSQVKGKLNRVPAQDHDEAAVLNWIFDQLGINPKFVEDYNAPGRAANPARPTRTFDQPPGTAAPQRNAPPSDLKRYAQLKRKLMR